jgi:hypothetical protein
VRVINVGSVGSVSIGYVHVAVLYGFNVKNEPTLNQQIAVLNQQTGSLNQHFRTLWTEPT